MSWATQAPLEELGGPAASPGTVALVGGGPGDPGLVGLRALRLLSTATFVAYDRLVPPELLPLCPRDCERVYVGKLPDRHALPQPEINRLLVDKAQKGHAVVRLKGGDPFVLGRGSEEAQACVTAGVPFEVVPAVTSAIAAPAYAGIPVTHRGTAPAFAVVTGHEDPTKDELQVDWKALATFPGTLVLLMAVGRIRQIATALVAAGKDPATPVALVGWGTTPRQRTVSATLADVADTVERAGIGSPAVTVVGDVAALRDEIAWFDRRPLSGVSVLVPRTRHQAGELSTRLRALGAEPVEAPTIAIEPTREPERLRQRLLAVGEGAYDWVAFTSSNGVAAVWEAIEGLRRDARLLAPARLAAVGPGTAEALGRCGLRADLVPERSTTRGLAEALIATGGGHHATANDPGEPLRVLLPRADIATPALTAVLDAAGWVTDEVEAYRTVPAEDLPTSVRHRLERGDIDVLAFASSSTVRNFVALLGKPPDSRMRVASIGPVTSETCADLGLRVDAEGEPHDLDGLISAVIAAAAHADNG
ncbi:MAG: uroporphyrinogen-III C-methyltransferase [Nitriliruptorales bacterium]|nr:uroporphyrinogen-III C-methyltransferase [Nitriliruptorales bacterium]